MCHLPFRLKARRAPHFKKQPSSRWRTSLWASASAFPWSCPIYDPTYLRIYRCIYLLKSHMSPPALVNSYWCPMNTSIRITRNNKSVGFSAVLLSAPLCFCQMREDLAAKWNVTAYFSWADALIVQAQVNTAAASLGRTSPHSAHSCS